MSPPVTADKVADAIAESIWHWFTDAHIRLLRSVGWHGEPCEDCAGRAHQHCDDLIAVAEEHAVEGDGTGELIVAALAERLLERTEMEEMDAAVLASQMLVSIWEIENA